METGSAEITHLLASWKQGDVGAEERLMSLVYPHLHAMAMNRLPRDDRAITLQATDLVHEVYLKLIDQTRSSWRNRAHFFAVVSRVMRRIVIDYIRRRGRVKRGGGEARRVPDEAAPAAPGRDLDWLALDQSLAELATVDVQAERIVEMRYFAGMTIEEVAEVLKVSPSSVTRSWRFARAWLRHRLEGGMEDES